MTLPISDLPAPTSSSSSSRVIVRTVPTDPGLARPAERTQPGPSKLPTFVRGRVLAKRFFVDEVFEVTPPCMFLRGHDLELERVVLVRLSSRAEPRGEGASGWFRRLDHPLGSSAILGTLGVGMLHGAWPLLVCQYWRGRSLEGLLRSDEPADLLSILRIARQIALALEEAHRAGHTHGDLRSEDVWLARQPDGAERAMLLGFRPRGSHEAGASLVARDLNAFGDLLSLMVASLLPRYGSVAHRAAFDSDARGGGPLLVVILGPLARVAARCQEGSTGRRYTTAGEVASALEQVEAVATKLSAE